MSEGKPDYDEVRTIVEQHLRAAEAQRSVRPGGQEITNSSGLLGRYSGARVLGCAIVAPIVGFLALVVYGTTHPRPDLDAVSAAKEAVERQLKDAGSAEYRDIHVYLLRQTKTYLVCGEVNGRNSYGGMAGYSRFIALGGDVALIESSAGDGSYQDLWDTSGCNGSKGELVATP